MNSLARADHALVQLHAQVRVVAANPAGLSSFDLALVESWRYRKAGSFYIFRTLKAYTVFLTDRAPQHAYGVQGLVSPIEDLTPLPLPVYTEAVLLPFEGQIIYDSMLQPYPVSFGPNIRLFLSITPQLPKNLQIPQPSATLPYITVHRYVSLVILAT